MVLDKLPAPLKSSGSIRSRAFGKVPLYLVMVVPLLVQVVGVVATVGWLSYRNGQQGVRQVATQLRSESGSRVKQHLDTYLGTPMQINRINADAADLGLLNLKNFSTTGKYFWRQMQTFNVGYISFGTPTGDYIGVERLDTGELQINEKSRATQNSQYTFSTTKQGDRAQRLKIDPTYNPLIEGWYADAIKAGKPVWSSIYQWDDKPNILSVSASYPLYDANRRLIGVLSVDQILTQISDFLSGIQVSHTGQTYIMERSGKLVATSHSNQKPFQVIDGKATRLAAVNSEDALIRDSATFLTRKYGSLQQIQQLQQLDFEINGQQQFLLVMPWKDTYGLDWLIVVVVPEADFMAQIHANTRNTILSCAIALALATLFGIPISRWIAQQILRLSRASEALANGQLHQVVQAKGIIELETLAKSFNRMAEQLRASFAELERTNEVLEHKVEERTASLTAAEAELRALFMAMSDLVIVYDRQGVVQKIVSTYPKLVSPATDQIGKQIYDLLTPSQADRVMQAIQQVLKTQELATVEYTVAVEDQEIWFSANVSPLSQDQVLFVARDVSDRKQTEAALRSSQDKFAKAFSASPDFITITSLETGRFLDVNDSFLQRSGFSREEVVGKTTLELGAWVNRRDAARIMQLLNEQGAIYDLEVELRTKSGEAIIALLSAEVIELDSAPCMLAVTKDITDRKRAEAAVQESQKKYRDLVESTNSIIVRMLPSGVITFLNTYGQQFFGYAEADIVGHSIFGTITPRTETSEAEMKAWLDFISSTPEHHQDIEAEQTRSTGEQVWVKWSTKAIVNQQGEVVEILSIGFDISDRKRAEAALQEKEQYLRLILNNIPQQVFWKGTNLTFMGCNRNWAIAIGLTDPEEIIGKTDYDLLPSTEVAEQFRAQDLKILASGTPTLHQIAPKVRSSDGKTVWLDISKIPIHDTNGNIVGILGVVDDITQRKEAEEALKAEQEKTELLLLNVLPDAIAQQLKQSLGELQAPDNRALIAESFGEVTVLFADIVNFTTISSNINATDLVGLLNRIFTVFDDLCDRHGLEKIKTIGDAYMVVGGLPNPRYDHAEAIADMALDMQEAVSRLRTYEGGSIQVRVGINTGPVIAGVIGKKKFTYDLWGDVVNTASRMESHGIAGKIQVTESTYNRLKHAYQFESRGTIEVKGKGELHTYWLICKT